MKYISVLYIFLLNGLTVMKARNCSKLMMRPDVKNAAAKNRCTIRNRLNFFTNSSMVNGEPAKRSSESSQHSVTECHKRVEFIIQGGWSFIVTV